MPEAVGTRLTTADGSRHCQAIIQIQNPIPSSACRDYFWHQPSQVGSDSEEENGTQGCLVTDTRKGEAKKQSWSEEDKTPDSLSGGPCPPHGKS